jgi:acetyl-CoA acetyltransferase
MTRKARIAGVGMVPFATPSKAQSYDVMGEQATRAALADAGIGYELVQQAYVGYVYGDSTSGQKALYRVGHPPRATGLAQCAELVWQLRGRAEARQVEGARLALQHNVGLGGVAVVTLYENVG